MPVEQRPSGRLGPAAIAAFGLLIAFAGALAPEQAADRGSVAGPLGAPLPEWLIVATAAAVVTAGLLFLALVFTAPRIRRKKKDDDFIEYSEPRKLHPALALLLLLLALSPGAILGGAIIWFERAGGYPVGAAGTGYEGQRPGPTRMPPEPMLGRNAGAPRPVPPLTIGLFATLALLAGFGSLAVVAWLWLGNRLSQGSGDPQAVRALLGAAVDDSLEDLRIEPDARTAIIRAYRHFERALAAADLPRRPWQTPSEFMRATLARLPLPGEAVSGLTRLFELARFSRHQLGAPERETAMHALGEIRARLEQPEGADAAS